jgi:hypothetical protein
MFMFCGYMTFFTYDKAFSLAFINAIHLISTEKNELQFQIREFIIKLYCVGIGYYYCLRSKQPHPRSFIVDSQS